MAVVMEPPGLCLRRMASVALVVPRPARLAAAAAAGVGATAAGEPLVLLQMVVMAAAAARLCPQEQA